MSVEAFLFSNLATGIDLIFSFSIYAQSIWFFQEVRNSEPQRQRLRSLSEFTLEIEIEIRRNV